jgi:hypothetical protein
MSDAEIEQKREEDERLDTAEDPNEEVRCDSLPSKRTSPVANATTSVSAYFLNNSHICI